MGTKNRPGDFDCYANAEPDEPMFVLLDRDKHAALMVRAWADLYRTRKLMDQAELTPHQQAKYDEAMLCAANMDLWRIEKNANPF